MDENILVVPLDGIGEAAFDGRSEGNQRVFEFVRFVERERRIMPVSGLLDEAVERRLPAGAAADARASRPGQVLEFPCYRFTGSRSVVRTDR